MTIKGTGVSPLPGGGYVTFREMTLVDDALVYALWTRLHLDTADIARRLGLREFQVANALPDIRSRFRGG